MILLQKVLMLFNGVIMEKLAKDGLFPKKEMDIKFFVELLASLLRNSKLSRRRILLQKIFCELLNQELDDTSTNEGLQKIFSIFANP